MVMVIPQKDIWEDVGVGLGAGLSKGLSEKFTEMKQKKTLDELYDKLQAEGASQMDQLRAISTAPISDDLRKTAMSGLSQMWKQEEAQRKAIQQKQQLAQLFPGIFGDVEDGQEAPQPREGGLVAEPTTRAPGDFVAEQPRRFSPEQATSEQITALSSISPKLAKTVMDLKGASDKERIESYKMTKDYRDETTKGIKGYKQTVTRLNRMETLNEGGKLDSPLKAKFLENLGLDFAMSPESQEYNKLVNDFTKNARDYYGARVTNFELQRFLKMLPTLQNSKAGRELILGNMRLLESPKEMEYNLMRAITKAAKKERSSLPLDLQEEVFDSLAPELDKMAQEFKSNLSALEELQKGNGTPEASQDTFEEMPAAAKYSGKIIRDDKTGVRYKSDGTKWRKV